MITGHQLKNGMGLVGGGVGSGPKRLNTSGSSAMQAASSGNNSTAKHVMKMIQNNNGNNSHPSNLHAANLGNIVATKPPKQLNIQMAQSHPLKSDAISNVAHAARASVSAAAAAAVPMANGSRLRGPSMYVSN